jgi:hypothetical protein
MVWLWSALVVIVLAALIVLISLSRSRWTVIQTESGARIDLIDRLYAYLKSQGIKSRLSGDERARSLQVRKQDEERARGLADSFQTKT